ncbi:hypothetical protein CBP36_19865 (plasmid) [Acidovorax carolinensis]|uniref:Uncharacterized protein n=1 Tax=Acidovorax carolinensis TaxID=553814 RepID=A0A240UJD3_9BURK|nr:hypothetical protein [Acidovorax carolinensis]ART57167.1 hypothetical protein CBP35_19835 [Acidovorax carolinensis]ART61225.1 hypothetical protein CBP36_19865 [Acidovorax carolinensis]
MNFVTLEENASLKANSRLKAIFEDIERNARLQGNTEILMDLDRIPCLLLGASNNFSDEDIDRSNASALDSLEKISAKFSAQTP